MTPQEKGTSPIDELVLIYEKEDDDQGKRYRVQPAPKIAKQGTTLMFRNLTDAKASVHAPGLLKPEQLELEPDEEKPAVVVGARGRRHRYKVRVGEHVAHGQSDPDLIIP